MKFRYFASALLAVCFPATGVSAQIVVGQAHGIHSSVLNEERSFRVFLPDSYEWATDRRYPVLYVLDGESDFLHSAVSVGFLAAHGEIPEMIVVGIDSTVRVRDFTQTEWPEAWVGGGGAGNFKRFLANELIPVIERTYRTDGFRALSGHSAGGQFTLFCLSSEPSLFRAYLALSPSLDWDHNVPQRSLEKAFASMDRLEAFLYVARSDDAGQALADYEQLVKTLQTKSPPGFRWFSQAFPNETHAGMTLLAQIDALRRLYLGYRFHADLLSKGFAYAEQHFRDVSRTVGWPLAIPESVVNDFAYEALAQGKTRDAIRLFRRNVEANPNSANAHDGLADGYEKAGQWQDAARAAGRAVQLATRFGDPNLSQFIRHAKKINDRLAPESAPAK